MYKMCLKGATLYQVPSQIILMAMIFSIYLEHEGIVHLAKEPSYQVREYRFRSRSNQI